jgi:hypothetical protein
MYETKCGENAKFFEENENKIVTVPYYFALKIVEDWPVWLFIMVVSLCIC